MYDDLQYPKLCNLGPVQYVQVGHPLVGEVTRLSI